MDVLPQMAYNIPAEENTCRGKLQKQRREV